MAAKYQDQEFLENLIKALVANPNDVSVTRNVDEMGVLLSLKINQEDMGQVIGRQGSTARSIRTLLRIVGLRNNARVNLKIEEPEGSTRKRPTSSSDDELKL
ncbi:KH domain-containing protein [Patescibacteria group bacterium AH-259-L05]|nr:KH domain-containing protein [Patescibacteria group bacterium AH-259-L05]